MAIIKGKVYVLKDDIDTDQIIPANFLNLVPTIPEEYDELGSHAMAGLPDSYQPFMKSGEKKAEYSILIAGRNFGCGSSREHAPVALGAAGVDAVIAESFARIFFRNCIATGEVYPLEVRERLCDIFSTGDEAEINIEENIIVNKTNNITFETLPLGAAKDVIDSGGIFEYARKEGLCS